MNKLTKLTINKFRNVKPTTLEFRPGINVVLGKNAAGKTTLLRLLATVIGADDDALQDDELNVNCRAFGATLEFEHALIKQRVQEPTISLETGQHLSQERSILHRTDSFVFEKNNTVVLRAEMSPNAVFIERDGSRNRVENLAPDNFFLSVLYALMKEGNSPALTELRKDVAVSLSLGTGRMDESLEVFNRLLKLEIRKGENFSHSNFKWDSRDVPSSLTFMFLEELDVTGTSATFPLKFLDRVAKVLGYDSASARFDTEHLRHGSGQKSVRFSNIRFFFKRPSEEVSHELLSYGQKRLLAFFAHVDASGNIVIADELVNGLHHEWITACLEEIGDRQAFLTSQNPLLLDFLRFDSAEEVRRAFILCERIDGEAGAQLVWRNPTEEEADSFFSAYQTGIQRVSDILLTKGLW